MTGWIGISLGDATGVGPEVALKAVAAEARRDGRNTFSSATKICSGA